MNAKKNKRSAGQGLLYAVLGLLALSCLLPMVLVVIASFSSATSISTKGFSFFPTSWSLDAWRYVVLFKDQLLQSYKVTLFVTVAGVFVSLLLNSMFGYALSRKDFMLRNAIAFYLLITMLFSGGMLASYIINTNVYKLRNNLLVLILPGVGAGTIIVMRTFIQSNVPDSLVEAAKIDGANEFYLFFRIIIPIMLPCLGAYGFMGAVGQWNAWQNALLYIDNPKLTTLQLMLIRIEKNIKFVQEQVYRMSPDQMRMAKEIPTDSARMAILLCTLGPIMIIYPFFQKYFVKGITVGSVKG